MPELTAAITAAFLCPVVALWLHAEDSQDVHDTLAEAGVKIVAPPFDGPFGRTFSFSDPDGYVITIHDKA